MHSMTAKKGTGFSFNPDFSGEIIIIARDGRRIEVPGSDVLQVVASFVANQRIAKLEDQSADEILGIPIRHQS